MIHTTIRLAAIALLLAPSAVLAWGAVGHHAICQIAYEGLTRSARREVDRLIELDPDYENFATSCTFADWPERQRPVEHYI
ncbi:MAG: S1/P1 nuclease, partial [Woeseiaceae bacterium]|nr:S1/P1 nuclease [Woeseiaceae bacterium]